MNSKRTFAGDRRITAVHEAGHLVIARRLGLEVVSAWIMPNDAAPPDERTWIGRVQIFRLGEKGERARRMVGVAGSVAEWLWFGGWIEDFFPDAMSESDWHLAGCAVDQPDDALMQAASDVGELFARGGPGWQELVAESRRLIVESRG
jgi:hypothetical protein